MAKVFKSWCKKVFVRNIDLSKKGFLYFLLAYVFFLNSIEFIILQFFDEIAVDSALGITFLISFLLSLVFAGLIVDHFKDRMKLLIISALVQIIGFILAIFSQTFMEIIGFGLIAFFSGVFLVDLLTILTHESTILSRGRLASYFFFFSLILSTFIVLFSFGNPVAILCIQIAFFILLFYVYRNYSYIETEDRLQSDYKFREAISRHPIMGYLAAFFLLGFILGNAFPVESIDVNPFMFIIISLFILIIVGVLLDNMGRKWSFTGSILVISSLIIFASIFLEIYEVVFFGVSIPAILLALFTFAGDFSTERNTVKYRGRISALFLLLVVGGFIFGLLMKNLLYLIYESDMDFFYWMPAFINGINSFLLVLLLVWIMPLPEVLSARESDWASTLKNLYVFNKESICLFAKNFLTEEDMINLPPEDLITGGLTGVLTLISEITNEKKNLRIIDKDKIKIYFSYGRNVIVALISTRYLPILFKKLDIFTKAFEKQFEDELENFTGKINTFLNGTERLVNRYFK